MNEIDSVVHDSGANVLEGITALAMEAGALAVATCKRVEPGKQVENRLHLKDEKVCWLCLVFLAARNYFLSI